MERRSCLIWSKASCFVTLCGFVILLYDFDIAFCGFSIALYDFIVFVSK